jgi:hypothetical protein
LARANTKLGELADAAYYYRQLAKLYPKVIVRDGKTGEELYLELATDKRFLPYLEDIRPGLIGLDGPVRVQGEMTYVASAPVQALVLAEPADAEVPPFFRRYRLAIDLNQPVARLIDTATGQERHHFPLRGMRVLSFNAQYRPQVKYHLCGQTMVFTWGHFLYLYNPVPFLHDPSQHERDVVRPINLLGGLEMPSGPYSQVAVQLLPQPNGRVVLQTSQNTVEPVGTIGVVTPRAVAYTVKDRGLVVLDPVTGQERWSRADIASGLDLFGDGTFVCSAPPKEEPYQPMFQSPSSRTAVVRLLDGAATDAPDFADQYKQRRAVHGRCLLLRDQGPQVPEGGALRLYDVTAGRDVWMHHLKTNAVVLDSVVPDVTGVLQSDGKLRLYRIDDGGLLLAAQVPPGEAAPEGTLVHLLADERQWYVFTARPQQPAVARRNVYPGGQGVRSIAIAGPAYAFDRATGAQRWRREIPSQALVVERFAEMPLILCAGYQAEDLRGPGAANVGRRGAFKYVNCILALDKREGTVLYDEKRDTTGGLYQYHTLKFDAPAGRLELITANHKVTLLVSRDEQGTQ